MKNVESLDVYKHNKIRQSNITIDPLYGLSLNAYKFLKLLACMIKEDDQNFNMYYFRTSDIMKLFGLSAGSGYAEIPKATKELMSKIIDIKISEKKIRQYPLLAFVEHDLGSGIVGAKIDLVLKPMFLNLNQETSFEYTIYYLSILKSTYSARLYELMMMNLNKENVTYSLKYLKEYLDANEKSYDRLDNFKKRVIDASKDEISQKTDIKFHYSLIKENKKCVALKFEIANNEVDDVAVELSIQHMERLNEINDILTLFKNSTDGADLDVNTIKELIDNKGFEIVKYYAINIMQFTYTGVNSIQGLFIDAVKKHNTDKQYNIPKKNIISINVPQSKNFEQRKYSDEYFNSLYANKQ